MNLKKKNVSLLGIFLFIIYILFTTYEKDINNVFTNKDNKEENNPIIEEVSNIKENIKPDVEIDNSNFDLKVYFIDVGQADSILIQNNNENMLIDAGNNEDGEKLVSYLKSLGITNFKYVVGTHPHEDHIGGLDDIIDNFNIEEVLLPNAFTTTKTFEDVLISLENKNMMFTVPKIDSVLSLGNSNINVLYTGENTTDLNDASIVLKLNYKNNAFLFSGDATTKVEETLLNKDLKVDVYKVAHHGSSSSNSLSFLQKLNPTYGIISVGKDNSYKHPHEEVMKRLNNLNIKLYRTDELGTILVSSNGTNIKINNFKTDTNG